MNRSLIGVYKSNQDAISALYELQKHHYPIDPLSIVAKADIKGSHIHVKANDNVEKGEVSIGIVAGAALGILTGIGVFAIPGFGLLFGAGALVGAFAGVETGFLTGGIVALLTDTMGIDKKDAMRYEKHLNEGNFLLFAPGDKKQIELAKHVLHTQGLSLELDTN
jgi:uncharacterized membrane protein